MANRNHSRVGYDKTFAECIQEWQTEKFQWTDVVWALWSRKGQNQCHCVYIIEQILNHIERGFPSFLSQYWNVQFDEDKTNATGLFKDQSVVLTAKAQFSCFEKCLCNMWHQRKHRCQWHLLLQDHLIWL